MTAAIERRWGILFFSVVMAFLTIIGGQKGSPYVLFWGYIAYLSYKGDIEQIALALKVVIGINAVVWVGVAAFMDGAVWPLTESFKSYLLVAVAITLAVKLLLYAYVSAIRKKLPAKNTETATYVPVPQEAKALPTAGATRPEPKVTVMQDDGDSEKLYEQALDELESGQTVRGTWARALAEANGEDAKAKAMYLRLRVPQLQVAREAATAEAKRIAKAEEVKAEVAKAAVEAEREARWQAAAADAARERRLIAAAPQIKNSKGGKLIIVLTVLGVGVTVGVILFSQWSEPEKFPKYSDITQPSRESIGNYLSKLLRNRERCKTLADEGNSDAELCVFYMLNAKNDEKTGAVYLRRSADKGNPVAQYEFSLVLDKGRGVSKNEELGLSYLRRAAEAGQPNAQVSLGWSYMTGDRLAINFSEAFKWNTKAADSGHGEGASNIGLLYENGWGVPKDFSKAVEWHKKAISMRRGSGQAEVRLGWLYQNGWGVQKDLAEAARLYRLIIDNNEKKEEFRAEAKKHLAEIK